MEVDVFKSEVVSSLEYYVYRLIDPRNGETFYVGKGKGNRVFHHAAGSIEAEDTPENETMSNKLKRIREIKISGFDVQHVIHRHGMNSSTAFEVEGALIDAYPGLTNDSGGHANADRGVAHSSQIIERYTAQQADITDKAIEIIVSGTATDIDLYNAVRFSWRLSRTRASRADYALAVTNGLIVGVFTIQKWLPATPENFPEFRLEEAVEKRYGFVGERAPEEIVARYCRLAVPPRVRGAANPIRYHNI